MKVVETTQICWPYIIELRTSISKQWITPLTALPGNGHLGTFPCVVAFCSCCFVSFVRIIIDIVPTDIPNRQLRSYQRRAYERTNIVPYSY